MVKEQIKNKKPKTVTAQAELENKTQHNPNYTGYFYNQIDRIWDELHSQTLALQELQAKQKGEY